jgi:thiamine biosynthesis lipoprotein
VGIEDPADTQKFCYRYELGSAAVATSGFSKRGDHIAVRDAGHSLAQATVLASDVIVADVWATAALSMGREEFIRAAAREGLRGLLVSARHELIEFGGEKDA